MRASLYATQSRIPSVPRQQRFDESLFRDEMLIEDVRLSVVGSWSDVPHGLRKRAPILNNLVNNTTRKPCVNHFAETAVTMGLGLLALSGREAARRPFRVIDAMICARSPEPYYSLEELQQLETEIEGSCNNLQMQYVMGDRSMKVKREMLEKFERIYDVIGKIIAQLRQDVYGGPRR